MHVVKQNMCQSTIFFPPDFPVVNEVWREQTLNRLLKLVELPLLEGVLQYSQDPPSPPRSTTPAHRNPDLIFNSNHLDRRILEAFKESQWVDLSQMRKMLRDWLYVESSSSAVIPPTTTTQGGRVALRSSGLPGLPAWPAGGGSQQGAVSLFPTGPGQRAASCRPEGARRRKVSRCTSELSSKFPGARCCSKLSSAKGDEGHRKRKNNRAGKRHWQCFHFEF